MNNLFQKLITAKSLSLEEYTRLAGGYTPQNAAILRQEADKIRKSVYGDSVYIRGLVEISNICKNDCYYCGIRASNKNCDRYRLTPQQILECAREGEKLGLRTFVLQGGEDGYFTDEVLCKIISQIKSEMPHCAVTLSLGERTYESYSKLKEAGADRYLLRHETANCDHYRKLHPENLSLENRMKCLENLREIGFQVGAGFMVGSPYQTAEHIAQDLKFIEKFQPDMCGIGPFIPHKDTPFADFPAGSAEYTCYLLSIIRIICPSVLLPATTALATVKEDGRELGLKSGANVIMPNLSPQSVREKYMLYNDKKSSGDEAAEELDQLKFKINSIGYRIVTDRGDVRKENHHGKV